ncbi:MAG: iron-sulfur cluster assembly scaffold protein [Candidatus Paceibacterota bacterium]|jgi:nitrogen fixation NifU-like protein
MYTNKVLEHFYDPHNYGRMKNPDGVGEVGNPSCGDVLRLYIKVKNDKIIDIKFETLGCAAAIAVSSMTTDMVMGKTLNEALKIKKKDIADELGGLPEIKMHCSNLAEEALKLAIEDYQKKVKDKK